jgi:hypothetical protein
VLEALLLVAEHHALTIYCERAVDLPKSESFHTGPVVEGAQKLRIRES